jgi:hypothetical protein
MKASLFERWRAFKLRPWVLAAIAREADESPANG